MFGIFSKKIEKFQFSPGERLELQSFYLEMRKKTLENEKNNTSFASTNFKRHKAQVPAPNKKIRSSKDDDVKKEIGRIIRQFCSSPSDGMWFDENKIKMLSLKRNGITVEVSIDCACGMNFIYIKNRKRELENFKLLFTCKKRNQKK